MSEAAGERTVTPFTMEFWTDAKNWRLLGLACALLGSFLVYGVLQERIMTIPYGPGPEDRFHNSAYLVLNNRIVGALLAIFMIMRNNDQLTPVAPIYTYAGVSVSNVIATWCQYEALRYVSFPTQTLGKCGKAIPVMILGALLSGKKYVAKDYLQAAAVTAGCMIFLLTGETASHQDTADTPFGIMLILGYLFSDGFTSTLQEKMFKGYSMSKYNQMLYVNLVSGTFSLIACLAQGELLSSLSFSLYHPSFFFHAFLLSCSSVAGQVAILTTIKEFGALTFAIIMTTRQFLNILLSCLLFLHPLTMGQWLGTAVVFATLYYQNVSKKPTSHGHGHGGHGHGGSSGSKPAAGVVDVEAGQASPPPVQAAQPAQ